MVGWGGEGEEGKGDRGGLEVRRIQRGDRGHGTGGGCPLCVVEEVGSGGRERTQGGEGEGEEQGRGSALTPTTVAVLS